MRIFGRKAVITIDTAVNSSTSASASSLGVKPALEFTCGKDGFDCQFDVSKDLSGKPNKATIDVYNLTSDHRAALSERASKKNKPVRVRLEAGYEDGTARIFEGDLRILYHERSRGDIITRVETGDGDAIASTARIFRSWGPGTPVAQVIKDIAATLNIGEGNVRAATAGALLEGWGPTYTQGAAAAGRSFQELSRICRSAGLLFSIQDGTLQFLVEDKALNKTAVLVTPDTGMVDTIKIDHKGRLHLRMLMIPDVFPGRKIQLADKSVWRVDKAKYSGHTKGNQWHIDIEGTPISS